MWLDQVREERKWRTRERERERERCRHRKRKYDHMSAPAVLAGKSDGLASIEEYH